MKIAIFFIACFFSSSQLFAGYALPKPPPTWKPNPSGSGGLYQSPRSAHRDAANNNWYTDVAEIYLPGAGNIKYPVSMKEASNAANFVAKNAFLIPTLSVAALTLMANWLANAGLQTWIDPLTGEQVWATPQTGGSPNGWAISGIVRPTKPEVCAAYGAYAGWVGTFYHVGNDLCMTPPGQSARPQPFQCPSNTVITPGGCVPPGLRTVTQPEFETIVSPQKIPVELPPLLPFPLPVEDPRTNPTPFPFGDPQPWFSPSGDPYPAPQPRPDPDPYPWREPGYDVVPSPKPAPDPEPWRLNPKPVEKPKLTPEPSSNPNPTPTPQPSTTPPPPLPPGSPPPEKDPGLCALFPDIIACAKLGTMVSEDIPNKDVPIAINPTSGIGNSNGTCPADKTVTLALVGQISVSYSFVCQYVLGLRPVIIALAWLTAAFTLFRLIS